MGRFMNLMINEALNNGRNAHMAGHLNEASIFYNDIIQSQPDHPDANHNMGVVLFEMGKAVEALPLFKKALEVNASVGQYWRSYIEALIDLGLIGDAQIVLDQAKKIGAEGTAFDQIGTKISKLAQNGLSENLMAEKSRQPNENILDSLKLQQAFRLAHKKSKENRVNEAKSIYSDILAKFPHNTKAKDFLKRLLAEKITEPTQILEPQEHLAQELIKLHDHGQYQKVLEKVLQLQTQFPTSTILYNIQGVANDGLGQFETAIECYNIAIEIRPDHVEAHINLGNALQRVGAFEKAIVSYKIALNIRPGSADCYYNMAEAHRKNGALDEAIATFKHAISIKADYAEAYNNMGLALAHQEKLDAAIVSYRQAISIKPDYVEAQNNIGNALRQQGKLDAAITIFRKTIDIAPNHFQTYNNLGIALKNHGDLEAAIDHFKIACIINTKYHQAYSNMGNTLMEMGDIEASILSYEQALNIKPDYNEALFGKSISHLLMGDMSIGFELFEARLRRKKDGVVRPPRRDFVWDGMQKLKGKRFFVYQEQGLGDTIQFCRYLPLLKSQGASVSFMVDPKLHTLLGTLGDGINLCSKMPSNALIDFEAPLLSLPHLMGTQLDTVTAPESYLCSDASKLNYWKQNLNAKKFKIGICWQGSKGKVDIDRSFPLSLFEGISRIPNVELISLHKGEGESQIDDINFTITTLGADFDSGDDAFVDTAAVMMNCDLIITSDTAIAHLAGALGRITWVALKHVPDWRWMLGRPDSPWYPKMSLYRQERRQNWTNVFARIERDLTNLILKGEV